MEEKKERTKYKKILTKSNYLLGLQCTKLLHVKTHDKTRIPDPDDLAMYRFRMGDVIEQLAKTLFPTGIDIPHDDFTENLRVSTELLEKRKALFEPAFKYDQLYSRADVLVPVGEDEWDIVEMKSATKVKEVNLHDVSFQKYIYKKCGLKIRKCFLMYINRDYIRSGELEPRKLFVQTDITEDVKKIEEGIEGRIEKMLGVINNLQEPKYAIGDHCDTPYECPIKKECWADLPNGNILSYYRKYPFQTFNLEGHGRIIIDKIQEFYAKNLNPFQKQMNAKKEGENFERNVLGSFFEGLEYPLHFLDIQTVNPAIPKYEGMQPYKRIPFRFSLLVQKSPGAKIEETTFVADGKKNPTYLFLKLLQENIDTKGTILTYDKFTVGPVIKGLVWNKPEFKTWSENLLPRIKDLWSVFENFHYYDIEKEFSHKIKYQIPKITKGLTHETLEIKNGESAGLIFEQMAYDPDLGEEEKEKMNKKLYSQGRAQTKSMTYILAALRDIYATYNNKT